MLRQLLLDGSPLIHQVNQFYRLPLRFRAHDGHPDLPRPDGELLYLWALNIDPQVFDRPVPVREFTLDQFLAAPVAHIGGIEISVHRVIDEVAHVLGGVHTGKPLQFSQPLHSWDTNLRLNGKMPVLGLLRSAAVVAARALQPLREAIANDPSYVA